MADRACRHAYIDGFVGVGERVIVVCRRAVRQFRRDQQSAHHPGRPRRRRRLGRPVARARPHAIENRVAVDELVLERRGDVERRRAPPAPMRRACGRAPCVRRNRRRPARCRGSSPGRTGSPGSARSPKRRAASRSAEPPPAARKAQRGRDARRRGSPATSSAPAAARRERRGRRGAPPEARASASPAPYASGRGRTCAPRRDRPAVAARPSVNTSASPPPTASGARSRRRSSAPAAPSSRQRLARHGQIDVARNDREAGIHAVSEPVDAGVGDEGEPRAAETLDLDLDRQRPGDAEQRQVAGQVDGRTRRASRPASIRNGCRGNAARRGSSTRAGCRRTTTSRPRSNRRGR